MLSPATSSELYLSCGPAVSSSLPHSAVISKGYTPESHNQVTQKQNNRNKFGVKLWYQNDQIIYNVLCKFIVLCWATIIAVLWHMEPLGQCLDITERKF